MTATAYFKYSKVLRRLREGPLGVYIDVYAAQLLSEGHCYQSGARCIRVVGDFSCWLARKRLDIDEVDECAVEQYQRYRAQYRHPSVSDRPALYRLLELLREIRQSHHAQRRYQGHWSRSSKTLNVTCHKNADSCE